jgi:RimJ/RimL family protein N-acetyltransferase
MGSSRTSRSTATVVEVRPATAADEGPLAALDRATWSWLSSPLPRPGDDWTFFHDQRPTSEVLVAEVDGAIAGYVRVAPATSLAATSHVLQIRGITVYPSLRGQGVGRALVDAAIAEARRRGARRLTLRVFAPNEVARRLYESAGFVVEGVQREEFFLNDQYVDDILMAFRL